MLITNLYKLKYVIDYMADPEIKKLKKQINQRHWDNLIKFWKTANWFWRIIMIIGLYALISFMYSLGQDLGTLIG